MVTVLFVCLFVCLFGFWVAGLPEELGRVRGPRPVHFDRRRGCGRGDRRGGDRARRAEEAREEEKDATRYRRRRLPRRRHRHRHCLKSAVSHPTSSHPEKSQTGSEGSKEREKVARSFVRFKKRPGINRRRSPKRFSSGLQRWWAFL